MTEYRKKLIEVALPLDSINRACKPETENPFLRNHPRALHVWWARTPLVACRAVLFASLVNDPSSCPEDYPTEQVQDEERQRLFRIIEELVKWENSTNEEVLAAARVEILRSTDRNPPPVLDCFCGRGSIPLEAQRLGLGVYASDLNPVAVLITKALIEIPPKFAGLPPVNPEAREKLQTGGWRGAQGLAEDVRYYGRWMRDEAERRIGHLYPKVMLPPGHGDGEATVIAWLWARTVKCPNPACGAEMPLVRSFALSTKKGKQAWVEPIVDHAARTVRFEVRTEAGLAPEGTVNRRGARCIVCGGNVAFEHIRSESQAGRMSAQLMAIVAEGQRRRTYVAPSDEHAYVAASANPTWAPESDLPEKALGFRVQAYGMTKHRDLYTDRQLVALTTFSDLVAEAREHVLADAFAADLPAGPSVSEASPDDSATASSYADAVATFLACAVSRLVDYSNNLTTWNETNENVRNLFQRQAVPMVWDFSEANVVDGDLTIAKTAEWVASSLALVCASSAGEITVRQLDARRALPSDVAVLVSTDPPYYDNIGYADLSDFFYVWLRRSLKSVYPSLFTTLLTPKVQELIASPHRFEGDSVQADAHFERGFQGAFLSLGNAMHHDFPMTIYYAYKQSEGDASGTQASTGWELMLKGLIESGLQVTGTWPMRTTKKARAVARDTNALASAVVLVCRRRPLDSPLASRREFLSALKSELPDALRRLQHGNIAPVDLAQASIGPGMAVFSRYSKVLEADGSPMSVRTALGLVNQALDEVVAEQEGEFDADTQWAIAWFSEHGMEVGEFGRAELLSKAKVTSVQGMVEAGILEARAGKVRLLRRDELDEGWDPATDERLTKWEMTQHLIRRLDEGEAAAAALVRQLGANAEAARDLAYRLYLICERKKWAQEARAYNALVVAWPQILQLATVTPAGTPTDERLF